MKILLIDNYDSFTYNLVHYLEGQNAEVVVCRNDEISFDTIHEFDKLVLSPGPGLPKDAGKMMEVLEKHSRQIPILGVCLGFQALVEFFGGTIYNQEIVKHGVAEKCVLMSPSKLFDGIQTNFNIGLYHSWAAKKDNFPDELQITALSETETIMAFEHKTLPIAGVQFHPESILTENGHRIIQNFLVNFNSAT